MLIPMNKTLFLCIVCMLATLSPGFTQENTGSWSLRKCIDYAREHNIQVQASRLSDQSGQVDLSQARAQLFPSLVFSSNQGWANQKTEQANGNMKSQGTYSGSYSLSSGLTLYNGGRLTNSIKRQEMATEVLGYRVDKAGNDIEIAVTEAFLQILYAHESLKTNRLTVESSQAQRERTQGLLEAGSVALSDLAQIEAQYNNDQYRVTQAENALAMAKLELKQLLELEGDEAFDIHIADMNEGQVLTPIPPVEEVYRTALEVMPEIKNSRLGIEMAELSEKIAAADRLPNLSLNASVGSGHNSQSDLALGKQLDNRLNESISVGISIPISRNRQVKSAIEKARLETEQAQLDEINSRKSLLRTIESLHQNAVAAQSRYIASSNSVRAATESYRLVQAQFEEGMRNTVELLTEKNNYLSALQEQIQAKYQAALSIRLLHFYQNHPIEL